MRATTCTRYDSRMGTKPQQVRVWPQACCVPRENSAQLTKILQQQLCSCNIPCE